MEMNQIRELAEKYVKGTATHEEAAALHRWYNNQEEDEEEVIVTAKPENRESVRSRMLARLMAEIEAEQAPEAVIRPIKSSKKWYWAAAAIAIGISIGGYLFFNRPIEQGGDLAKETRFKNDLPAGANRAILQLADGRQVPLDDASRGTLATQGGTEILMNAAGQVSYNVQAAGGESLSNSIYTPVGGQYSLVLADGSKVWLNAETKISFPVAFAGTQRKVNISGEAYFEVAKNPSKPFIVGIGQAGSVAYREVQVLGTHFNVKAYSDEAEMKTTLVEGEVLVSAPATQQTQILKPGQQVTVNETGAMDFNSRADVDEALAWQRGLFRFKDESIAEIMKTAQRWYDIDVQYEGEIADEFITTIPRQSTLQQFLTILETTGQVRFTIEGKKVTVIPVK